MRHRRRRDPHEPYQSGHGLGQGRSRRFYWLLWTRRRHRRWRSQCAWAYQAFWSAIGCPIFFGCSHCIERERHLWRIHGCGNRQEQEQRNNRLRCRRFLWSGQQHQDPGKPCDKPQIGHSRYQHVRWCGRRFRGLLHHRRPRRRAQQRRRFQRIGWPDQRRPAVRERPARCRTVSDSKLYGYHRDVRQRRLCRRRYRGRLCGKLPKRQGQPVLRNRSQERLNAGRCTVPRANQPRGRCQP